MIRYKKGDDVFTMMVLIYASKERFVWSLKRGMNSAFFSLARYLIVFYDNDSHILVKIDDDNDCQVGSAPSYW